MQDKEKNLIENLFHRLKNTELSSSERDQSADDLIQKLVKKQPSSSYYMAQTILIQETAIKKMSIEIEELKKRIKLLSSLEDKKKPSFLSSFFKSEPIVSKKSNDSNIWKNKDASFPNPHTSNVSPSSTISSLPASGKGIGGFLSNALQTATGVAGGMILGNMLMNVFNHSKPEEEVFDTMNISSEEDHITDNSFHHSNQNNLVEYDQNESNTDDDLYNDNYDDADCLNDIDSSDDDFI